MDEYKKKEWDELQRTYSNKHKDVNQSSPEGYSNDGLNHTDHDRFNHNYKN